MGRKRDEARAAAAVKPASAAPAASRWWPWAAGLVVLAALGVQGPSLGRPFVDRHDWSTAHQAQFARNHLRYGLGDTLTRCIYTRHIIAGVSNARTAYPDHPPLLSLTLAFAMWLGGVNDLAVRLVPALCTVAAIGLTMSIVRRLYGAAVALLAGVALLGLPILVYFGHVANHEPLALACGLLALRGYLGWVYPEAFGNRRGRCAVAFAVGTVLAILSGWVGLLIAGVIWLHFALGLRGVAWRRSVGAWALVTLPAFSAAVATFAHVLWSLGGGLEKLYGIFAFRAGLKEGVKAFDESPLGGWLLLQGEWLWRDFTVAGLVLAAVGLVALLARRSAADELPRPGRVAVLWLLGAPGLLFVVLFRTGSYEHDYWWLHVTPLVGLLIGLGVTTPVRALLRAGRTPVLVAAGVVMAALIGGEAWVRQDFYREPASPSWYEACTYVARETPADTPTYTNMSPWMQREYHDGPMLFLQPQLAWVLDRKLLPLPSEGGIRAAAARGGVYILMPKNARDQELGEYLFAHHRLLARWRQAAVFELVAEQRRGAADGVDEPGQPMAGCGAARTPGKLAETGPGAVNGGSLTQESASETIARRRQAWQRRRSLSVPSEWMAYLTHVDDQPASVLVDIGVNEAEAKRFPHLVLVRVAVRERRDAGLASEADYEEVGTLEDALEKALGQESRYVGRISTGTAHTLHIYTRRPEPAVATVRELAANLRGREVETRTEEDPDWSAYLEGLFPDAVELQGHRNEAVLQKLRESGDDLSKPRQVDHWLFLPDAASRAALAERLRKQGFRVVDEDAPRSEGERFGLHVVRVDSVQPEELKQVTGWLAQIADEHGGIYDGWETTVER